METPERLDTNLTTEASVLLACAFSVDPLATHILPDPKSRPRRLQRYIEVLVRASCMLDAVYVLGSPISGVAVWMGPGQNLTVGQQAEAGIDRLPEILGEAENDLYRYVGDHLNSLRHRDVPTPHWYLSVLGVDPVSQGQGIGGDLLRPILDEAEDTGTRCYLETFTEKNVAFYRRFGFEVVVHESDNANGIPAFWTMATP